MENDLEFVGSSLAITFMARALLATLVHKHILTEEDRAELLDRTLLALERQQNVDLVSNADVWKTAREFLDHLMSTVAIAETVHTDHECAVLTPRP
jgi:hypothetical protein